MEALVLAHGTPVGSFGGVCGDLEPVLQSSLVSIVLTAKRFDVVALGEHGAVACHGGWRTGRAAFHQQLTWAWHCLGLSREP